MPLLILQSSAEPREASAAGSGPIAKTKVADPPPPDPTQTPGCRPMEPKGHPMRS